MSRTRQTVPRTLSPRPAETFEIVSVGPLEPVEGRPWRRIAGFGILDRIDPPSPWLKQTGSDAELRVRRADGTFRAVLLALGGCFPDWSAAPAPLADHPLPLGEALSRPAGIPIRLCPNTG